MMLDKFPVPGRPAGLDSGGTRDYCACGGHGWGLFGRFCSRISFLFFPPLWRTARYKVKNCLKGR